MFDAAQAVLRRHGSNTRNYLARLHQASISRLEFPMRFLPKLMIAVALIGSATAAANADIYDTAAGVQSAYVQGTATIETTSGTPVAVPGMQLTLPKLTKQIKYAMTTFSAPTLYGSGACSFQIFAGTTQYVSTYTGTGPVYGLPLSITVKIPLGPQVQNLQVLWYSIGGNGGQCYAADFYSLSAILTVN